MGQSEEMVEEEEGNHHLGGRGRKVSEKYLECHIILVYISWIGEVYNLMGSTRNFDALFTPRAGPVKLQFPCDREPLRPTIYECALHNNCRLFFRNRIKDPSIKSRYLREYSLNFISVLPAKSFPSVKMAGLCCLRALEGYPVLINNLRRRCSYADLFKTYLAVGIAC